MAKLNELLLDTNFIIECGKRRLLDKAMEKAPGAKVVTLSPVVRELEEKGEILALELIRSEGIEVLPADGYADREILEYAKKGGVAVATNDRALKEELRKNGAAVVFPTSGGCEIVGGVL